MPISGWLTVALEFDTYSCHLPNFELNIEIHALIRGALGVDKYGSKEKRTKSRDMRKKKKKKEGERAGKKIVG